MSLSCAEVRVREACAQAVMGTVVKRHLAARLGHDPASIYHVAIMPCYDKKLEASRDDFHLPGAPRDRLLCSYTFPAFHLAARPCRFSTCWACMSTRRALLGAKHCQQRSALAA